MPETTLDQAAEDAMLVRAIAAGAQGARGAEAELCRRFAPRVRLYGLKHLRSEQAAADLIQQVLMIALERLRAGELREPEMLASFMLGTCRMVVLDWRRSHARRERLLQTYAEDVPQADAGLLPRLDHERLLQCLRALSERERAVVAMSFYGDKSSDEVARATALTAANVRVIRHRSLERLRDCMERRTAQ
jgi:RNA polymerase sigma-70 factor, ECF subfamily